MKILIVDDNTESCYLLERLLQGNGYDAVSVTNGAEALAELARDGYGLVVSDVLMPEMDGFRLCREVKGDARFTHIPFVFYTATYTDESDRVFALSLGAERFLIKPAEPDAFVRAIGEVIRDREAGALVAGLPVQDDAKYLKRYNERLIQKLEEKMVQLEQANRALADSRTFLHTMIQSEPDCVMLMTSDGRLSDMNPAGLAMFEAESFDAVRGTSLASRLRPADRAAFTALTDAVFQGRAGVLEFEITGLKGTRRRLEAHAVPLRNPAGAIIAMLGLTRDITERTRVEGDRASLLHVLESSLNEIYMFDSETLRFEYVNRGAQRNLGYSFEQLRGKTPLDLKPELTEASFREMIGPLLRLEKETHVFQTVHRRADGSLYPVEVHLQWVETGGRRVFLAIILDITERRRAEREIKALNEELEARVARRTEELTGANRELEAFSYSVSHDLRAPLRVIDGFSKVLLDDYRDRLDEGAQDHVRRIRAAADRMGHLIDDLLDLSRVSRTSMRREPVDLSALAQSVAAVLRATDPEREVEWVMAPGVTARGDSRLLRIALENLFGNAWKFTKRTERPRIEFGMSRDGGEAIYRVRDNGAGFDMAYADRLFGTFQRLHTADEFPGTGVGLAIVRRIIQRHGGRIWAEGAVGRGAVLSFTLNVREEA